VTVGLNCVLKFYLKGRLDCDDGNAVSSALLHVCMSYACLYILEIWNVKLYDYPELILIFYRLVTFKTY